MYSSAYPYSRLFGGLSGVLGSGEKGVLGSRDLTKTITAYLKNKYTNYFKVIVTNDLVEQSISGGHFGYHLEKFDVHSFLKTSEVSPYIILYDLMTK